MSRDGLQSQVSAEQTITFRRSTCSPSPLALRPKSKSLPVLACAHCAAVHRRGTDGARTQWIRKASRCRACASIRSDADLSPAIGQTLFCLLQKRTCAIRFNLARCTHWALPFWQFDTSRSNLSETQLRESPGTLSARSIRPTATSISITITTRTSISIEYPHHAYPGTYGSDRGVLPTDPPESRPYIGVDEGTSGEDDCRRERC